MKTPSLPGEQIIKNGLANLQRGAETVGGRLYLTNERLVFEAHQINVQTGTTEIALADVQSMQKCWTKFLDLIPLFPNSLAVFTRDGIEHRFVLFGRGKWQSAIDSQRKK